MEKISTYDKLVDKLEDCATDLVIVDKQIRALYDTIKGIKNPEERQALTYTYKQTYDALEKHTNSFRDLIRVVKEKIEDDEEPRKER